MYIHKSRRDLNELFCELHTKILNNGVSMHVDHSSLKVPIFEGVNYQRNKESSELHMPEDGKASEQNQRVVDDSVSHSFIHSCIHLYIVMELNPHNRHHIQPRIPRKLIKPVSNFCSETPRKAIIYSAWNSTSSVAFTSTCCGSKSKPTPIP